MRDLRVLPRQPGSVREEALHLVAPERIGLELLHVEQGATVGVDLRLESVGEGVLATGRVHAPLEGSCGRCLEPVRDTLVVEFRELFAYAGSSTAETTDPEDVHRVVDEHIDLLPVVRDATVLELPLNPVCREDCPGLCPECGERLEVLGPDHSHERVDPRWAGLASLLEPSADDGGGGR